MRLLHRAKPEKKGYDPALERPVIIQSICTGEQSLVFVRKDGTRRQVGIVRSEADLKGYAKEYGFDPKTVGREF